MNARLNNTHHESMKDGSQIRLLIGVLFFVGFGAVIIARLFFLMIFQHGFYTALAAGSHTLYAQLFPERGDIFVQDSRTGEEYPVAMNKDVFTVYADTRQIKTDDVAESTAEALAGVFAYDDEQKFQLYLRLNKRDDPYEPIEPHVEEIIVDELRAKDLPGIGFVRQSVRVYPEGILGAHVIGFVGKTEDGGDIGRYGVEGYWQHELAGEGGFLEASKSLGGGVIPLAGKSFQPAEDGVDILLTLDRTLQYKVCERLRQGMEEYGATSAALIIADPRTGAIRAMCSLPDFDPNIYNQVEDSTVYNNSALFTAYEPGSIFKPITMGAAINENVVSPDTYFFDSGSREAHCTKAIKNADGKVYEDQTMTGVLENSINTGMVFVIEELGKHAFIDYLERFGFGTKTGLRIDSEGSGTIDTLYQKKQDEIDCYAATASFGQGITVTPLQMVSSFGAIANGGEMMRPYIIEEIRYENGKVDRTQPEPLARMFSSRSASLLSAMLVNVVDKGHAGGAGVPGYYVAGKTGTAQIAGRGGYTEDTNHSFIGFAPVDDPVFVMIVKYEKPERRFSSATAAPVFGNIAKFALQYYQVPPGR